MKLLSKTSISYLWVSFTVLAITGVLLFQLLRKFVSDETREQLELQTEMVAIALQKGKPISFPFVEITPLQAKKNDQLPIFRDTLIDDFVQQKKEGYYYLKEKKMILGVPFMITVMSANIGWDGYSQAILFIFIIMACLLLLAGALVNYFINKRLWDPFLINLERLKQYSVSSQTALQLVPSAIDEFKELNEVTADLAKRAREEYTSLKEFTENASHEIQTPLMIIKSRLESISQRSIDEVVARYLVDTKQAVDRLSRLNRGLLLLAKLDNDTFPDQEQVNLNVILQNLLVQMADLFEQRNMTLQTTIKAKKVDGSPYLLEILITNLLSNILQHAQKESEIRIELDANHMLFSNPGAPLEFAADKLFARFGKESKKQNGNGLGLSIVKQICMTHHWEITYSYLAHCHIFEITF